MLAKLLAVLLLVLHASGSLLPEGLATGSSNSSNSSDSSNIIITTAPLRVGWLKGADHEGGSQRFGDDNESQPAHVRPVGVCACASSWGLRNVRQVGVCACASSCGLRMCIQLGSAHVRPVRDGPILNLGEHITNLDNTTLPQTLLSWLQKMLRVE